MSSQPTSPRSRFSSEPSQKPVNHYRPEVQLSTSPRLHPAPTQYSQAFNADAAQPRASSPFFVAPLQTSQPGTPRMLASQQQVLTLLQLAEIAYVRVRFGVCVVGTCGMPELERIVFSGTQLIRFLFCTGKLHVLSVCQTEIGITGMSNLCKI